MKLKAILIGAGLRGQVYTDYVADHADEMEIVAVAEPVQDRRQYIQKKHHLKDEMCFEDYKPLLDLGKIADVAIICTMDRDHFEPTMKAIELKYDILLEKPVAPSAKECALIQEAADKAQVKIIVCHVLRYTPFYMTLKKVLDDGLVGKIMSVDAIENVGNVHQSHSFVRGNWGNSEKSSFMLLQKCCHDMDILQWLVGKKCLNVSSFGHLSYFNSKNKPSHAPSRCIEGCPEENCFYNAVKLYLEDEKNDWFRCAATKKTAPTNEDVKEALLTGPYGRCVFDCDNDVVDHQVVNLEFEDDITMTFTMAAFNKGGREIKIMGTCGELVGDMSQSTIRFYDFKTRTWRDIPVEEFDENIGHGGGDEGIMRDFIAYLKGEYHGKSIANIDISCENHMIVFAAEQARLQKRVVNLEEFKQELKG